MPKRRIQSCVRDGEVYKLGDVVFFNPSEPAAPPYIGKVKEIIQDTEDEAHTELTVTWFYRPEEAIGGRKAFHGRREVFSSDHEDGGQHINSVIGRCNIHTLKKYEALPHLTPSDYYVRFHYRASQKLFEPDRVAVYCTCELPYNPDRVMVMCDTCQEWYHPECVNLPLSQVKGLQELGTGYTCAECRKMAANAQDKRAAPGKN